LKGGERGSRTPGGGAGQRSNKKKKQRGEGTPRSRVPVIPRRREVKGEERGTAGSSLSRVPSEKAMNKKTKGNRLIRTLILEDPLQGERGLKRGEGKEGGEVQNTMGRRSSRRKGSRLSRALVSGKGTGQREVNRRGQQD